MDGPAGVSSWHLTSVPCGRVSGHPSADRGLSTASLASVARENLTSVPIMGISPLSLEPVLVAKPWGGQFLAQTYRRDRGGDARIGECWLVADLPPDQTAVPDPWSVVASGRHIGCRLEAVIASSARHLLGSVAPLHGRFPLLMKVLDAEEHLSVQVHPTDAYANENPGVTSKTESWLVLEARPDACLYLGVKDGVARDDVRRAAGRSDLVDLLRKLPPQPGDLHHLPAGMVHALGAGVRVLEVQTPSDTTFRLYDWRDEFQRQPRPLHVTEGLEVIESAWDVNIDPRRFTYRTAREHGLLLDTAAYQIYRHDLQAEVPLESATGRARVLYAVDGQVGGDGFERPIRSGEVVLLPACWYGPVVPDASTQLIEVRVGSASD